MPAVPRRVILLLLLTAACKRQPTEFNGVGQYVLGKYKLVDGEVNFRCDKTGATTFCFGGPEMNLGEQPGSVSLYFGGKEPDAPLVEIALAVRACDDAKAQAALEKALGPPTTSEGKLRTWQKKAMFVSARMRDGSTNCDVSFVDPKDEKRVAELKAVK